MRTDSFSFEAAYTAGETILILELVRHSPFPQESLDLLIVLGGLCRHRAALGSAATPTTVALGHHRGPREQPAEIERRPRPAIRVPPVDRGAHKQNVFEDLLRVPGLRIDGGRLVGPVELDESMRASLEPQRVQPPLEREHGRNEVHQRAPNLRPVGQRMIERGVPIVGRP